MLLSFIILQNTIDSADLFYADFLPYIIIFILLMIFGFGYLAYKSLSGDLKKILRANSQQYQRDYFYGNKNENYQYIDQKLDFITNKINNISIQRFEADLNSLKEQLNQLQMNLDKASSLSETSSSKEELMPKSILWDNINLKEKDLEKFKEKEPEEEPKQVQFWAKKVTNNEIKSSDLLKHPLLEAVLMITIDENDYTGSFEISNDGETQQYILRNGRGSLPTNAFEITGVSSVSRKLKTKKSGKLKRVGENWHIVEKAELIYD